MTAFTGAVGEHAKLFKSPWSQKLRTRGVCDRKRLPQDTVALTAFFVRTAGLKHSLNSSRAVSARGILPPVYTALDVGAGSKAGKTAGTT